MMKLLSSPLIRLGLLFLLCLAGQLGLHAIAASSGYFVLLFLPAILLTAAAGVLPALCMLLVDAVLGVAAGNPRVYFLPVALVVVYATNELTGRGLIREPQKLLPLSFSVGAASATVEHILAYLLEQGEFTLPGLTWLVEQPLSPHLTPGITQWVVQVVVQVVNVLLSWLLVCGLTRRYPFLFPRCGLWAENSFELDGHPLMKRLMRRTGVMMLAAALVLFALLHESNVAQISQMSQMLATNYVNAVSQMVDPRGLPAILAPGGSETAAYQDMMHKLTRFYSRRDDAVKYFYIYQVLTDEKGEHYVRVICDMEKGSALYGNIHTKDDEYGRVVLEGRDFQFQGPDTEGPFYTDSHWGRLMSFHRAIMDQDGKVQAYVGVDMDRDVLDHRLYQQDTQVLSLEITAFALLMAITVALIHRSVLIPLKNILGKTRYFQKSGTKPDAPLIHTGDEFELLDKTMHNAWNLVLADQKRQTGYARFIHREAFRDSLTGARNHGSYELRMKELDASIREGKAAFAVLMVDMNGLKAVNDRLGHEKGDIAIRAASRTLTHLFGKEAVYRVGGDEFVVILEGDSYQDRKALCQGLAPYLQPRDWNASAPWEAVSFSAGLSVYEPGKDRSYADVFNRADRAMYAGKRGR